MKSFREVWGKSEADHSYAEHCSQPSASNSRSVPLRADLGEFPSFAVVGFEDLVCPVVVGEAGEGETSNTVMAVL